MRASQVFPSIHSTNGCIQDMRFVIAVPSKLRWIKTLPFNLLCCDRSNRKSPMPESAKVFRPEYPRSGPCEPFVEEFEDALLRPPLLHSCPATPRVPYPQLVLSIKLVQLVSSRSSWSPGTSETRMVDKFGSSPINNRISIIPSRNTPFLSKVAGQD